MGSKIIRFRNTSAKTLVILGTTCRPGDILAMDVPELESLAGNKAALWYLGNCFQKLSDAGVTPSAEITPASLMEGCVDLDEVKVAVHMLDPDKQGNWTAQGLPVVSVVSELCGDDVTRADIESACPGYTRTEATVNG